MLSGKFLLKSQIPHGDAFISQKAKAPLLLAPILTVQLAIADSLRDVGAPDVGGMIVDEAMKGMSFRNYKNLLLIGGGDHRTGKHGGNWDELRRFAEKAGEEDTTIIRLPQLEISLENYQVKAAGKVIPCTPKEVEILHMLTSNVGQVFSREQILSRVWGYDYFGDTRTVDAHIKRIRQKLPQEGVPWALKTVYGVGYRFEVNT